MQIEKNDYTCYVVGFQNISSCIWLLVLGCENLNMEISGTVETHDTYNLINSKLCANYVSVKSSDFLMFRVF